mmetsp:Transcript_2095/g.7605  ORF Transcript_2095/g.7605 Transcript_2095/m.7605 type:complete len:243 (+) Transcript_2095:80-808(+)
MGDTEVKDAPEHLSVPLPVPSPKGTSGMLLPKLAPVQGGKSEEDEVDVPDNDVSARNIVAGEPSVAQSSTAPPAKSKMRVRVSVSTRLKEELNVLFPDLGWAQTTTALSKVLEEVPTLVNAVRAVQRAAITHQDESLRLNAILTDRETVVKVLEQQVESKHALLVQYNADLLRYQEEVEVLKQALIDRGVDVDAVMKDLKEPSLRKRPGSDDLSQPLKRAKTEDDEDKDKDDCGFSDGFVKE